MAAPGNMATPTLQSLGDLTKEDDQMIIILHAVQFQGGHVAISRSVVGISIILYSFLIAMLLIVIYS